LKNKKAFTLVELIAVIAILGLIMIIAVPKVYNSISSNKKRTFIINAKNIVRQIEYDNIEFNSFTKIPLEDLNLKKISSKNIDLKNSVAYIVDDDIILDLVGKNDYKDFYLCNLGYTNEEFIVQDTPCDTEHNFIYIDFEVDLAGGSTSQNFNSKYLAGNYLVLQIPIKSNDTFLGWELVSGNSELDQNRIKFGTESTKIKAIWGNNPELVVNLNGGTTTQKFDSKYSGGSLILLEEPTKEGYTFKGWNLVTGNALLSGNVLTTGTTNTVIEALWELNEFNITYELNGGTKGENAPIKGKGGASVVISNPTKTGYIFKGWDVIGTGALMSGTILTMGSSDVILVANWEANTNIAYVVNHWTQNLGASTTQNGTNYTLNSREDKVGTTGSSVTPSVKTITGFTSPSTQTKTILADGSLVVDYYYTRNSYTFTLGSKTGANTSDSTASGSYQYGATITLNVSTNTGYTWSKWISSNTSLVGEKTTANTTFTMPAGNITMTPNVTINTYSLSYTLNGGAVSTTNKTSYTVETESFRLNNPTKTGYTFAGWTGSNGTTKQTSVSIAKGSTGDKSYNANWSVINYSITYDLDGGTVSTANKTSYTVETESFTLKNPTKSGYKFLGWTGSNGTTKQTSVSIAKGSTGNKSYTANWEKLYTPTLNSNYPADTTVVKGTSVTSKVTISTAGNPASYTYQWYKNGSAVSGATSSSYTFTPTTTGTTTVYCKVTNSAGTVTSRTATITATDLLLYDVGNQYTSVTGGWIKYEADVTVTFNSANIKFADAYGTTNKAAIYTSNKIDVTNYNKLIIEGTDLSYIKIGLTDTNTAVSPSFVVSSTTTEVDISSIRGNYYVSIAATYASSARITKIYLE